MFFVSGTGRLSPCCCENSKLWLDKGTSRSRSGTKVYPVLFFWSRGPNSPTQIPPAPCGSQVYYQPARLWGRFLAPVLCYFVTFLPLDRGLVRVLVRNGSSDQTGHLLITRSADYPRRLRLEHSTFANNLSWTPKLGKTLKATPQQRAI